MAERMINGVLFTCEKLPAEPGLALFLRASKVLRPAQGLLEAIVLEGDTLDLVRAFFDFVEGMSPDEVHRLVIDLAKLPTGGPPPDDIRGLLELAQFVLEVNFKDFLSGSLAAGQDRRPGQPSAVSA